MYENCCDNGERMPSYYLQTLGGGSFTSDWAFPSAPDMLLINLGTNDFGHDAGPAWEANFTATYVAFVLNATARYKAPKLPVFVAQGPMNNGAPLYNALQAAIKGVNEAGGNAFYLVRHPLPPLPAAKQHPGTPPPPPSPATHPLTHPAMNNQDMRGPPNDGCGGHPGVEGHKQMAALAQPQISKVMGW